MTRSQVMHQTINHMKKRLKTFHFETTQLRRLGRGGQFQFWFRVYSLL